MIVLVYEFSFIKLRLVIIRGNNKRMNIEVYVRKYIFFLKVEVVFFLEWFLFSEVKMF